MNKRNNLTLYGRPYCHLCQDMELQLAEVRDELGFSFSIIDIDSSPELIDKYNDFIPVLIGDGREICHYFLDLAALRRYLQDG